jgi:NADPH-dependent curcumin reductase CurA
MNEQVILTRRPEGGIVTADCFAVQATPMPVAKPGEVVLRNRYLSIDPYLLRLVNDLGVYLTAVPVGGPVVSRVVAEVESSTVAGFRPGDAVLAMTPWARYATAAATSLIRIDPQSIPMPVWLGALGQSGLTAWGGMLHHGKPRFGDNVVVTSAAGPVGQVAGQIARIQGARVIGVAGGPEKCAFVKDELGFDDCIDYRRPDFREALRAATPGGINVHWEAVGGSMLDVALTMLAPKPRVVIAGLIEHYDGHKPMVLNYPNGLLDQELTLHSFHAGSFLDRREAFVADMTRWVKDGRLRYRDTVLDGLGEAGRALASLQKGQVLGKMLVSVS